MCIGENETHGPKRCADDARQKCQTRISELNTARASTAVLEADRDDAALRLDILESTRAAMLGELTADREAELAQRIDAWDEQRQIDELRARLADYTLTPVTPTGEEDTPQAWDRRIAAAEQAAAGDRAEWEEHVERLRQHQADGTLTPRPTFEEAREQMRDEYERTCRACGDTPTDQGLDSYTRAEMAAEADYDEYERDILSGAYVQQWRDEAIVCHRHRAQHMDLDEALTTVDARCASNELEALVGARDLARQRLEDVTAEWDTARNQTPPNTDALNEIRPRLNDAYGDYLVARQDLDYYKDCTAQYAARAGDLHTEQMPQYSAPTLGSASYIGEYEQSTREWLEAHQQGMGGSDATAALGLDPYKSPKDVVDSKVRAITDAEVAEQLQGVRDHTGAAPRGHAWEPVMAKRFAEANPDLVVAHSKAAWGGDQPWQRAQLDAVVLDKDGNYVCPWESKTASDPAEWADGIPLKYRPQLGHQMDVTGADRAAITVNIDDHDFRTYWMRRDEPLDPNDPQRRTYADRKHELAAVWAKVDERRSAPADPTPPRKNNGKFSWVKNPKSESSFATNDSTARQLARYRGCTTDEATRLIQERVAAGDTADAAVRHCYSSYHPRQDPQRRFVVVDFETNGTHAGKHEILQTGYQVIDGAGTVHESANSYHDINPKLAPTIGVGMQEVHRIGYHSLAGRTPFSHSHERDRLRELAQDPNVTFVAHNANFEVSMLRGHGINPDRIIDTMNLSRKFDHESTGAKLSDFVVAQGISYAEDAHDASVDVSMTSRALLNFWNGR